MANGSPLAPNTREIPTFTSSRPRAASPSASPGMLAPIPWRAGPPTASPFSSPPRGLRGLPSAARRFLTVPADGGVEEPLPVVSLCGGGHVVEHQQNARHHQDQK